LAISRRDGSSVEALESIPGTMSEFLGRQTLRTHARLRFLVWSFVVICAIVAVVKIWGWTHPAPVPIETHNEYYVQYPGG
jgi:hypothetical protein